MLGTIINCIAVILGSIIGLLIGRFYTEEMKEITIKGLGLVTVILGIQMALFTLPTLHAVDFLVIIFSIVLGGITGVMLKIESRLEYFGTWLKEKSQSGDTKFVEAFVTASIIFETGPMAILGAINDGLRGDISLLLTKSALDGFVSIAFAATMGIGVIFSCIPVILYQGPITLVASIVAPFMPLYTQNMLAVVGGVIILGLGVKLLDLQKITIANLVPALLWVIPLSLLI